MYNICAIEIKLDTNQYNTRPEGNHKKNTEKITGIHSIIFCCIGSIDGVGVSFCIKNIEAPNKIGKIKYGSFADKSEIHKPNGAWRNSTLSKNTQ